MWLQIRWWGTYCVVGLCNQQYLYGVLRELFSGGRLGLAQKNPKSFPSSRCWRQGPRRKWRDGGRRETAAQSNYPDRRGTSTVAWRCPINRGERFDRRLLRSSIQSVLFRPQPSGRGECDLASHFESDWCAGSARTVLRWARM